MWQQEKLHPRILKALRHLQEGLDQFQQCDDVFFQRSHFVDEHEDKRHDEQCLFVGKMNLASHIRLPNQIAQQLSSYQIFFRPDFGRFERLEKHHISFSKDRSMYIY